MKEVTGQFIPLLKVFKKFFELPDCLEDAIAYRDYLENECSSGVLSNFMQSEAWKRKVQSYPPNSIVFPVDSYYDECEPNRDLGPHGEILGCGYVSLPCLPPNINPNWITFS